MRPTLLFAATALLLWSMACQDRAQTSEDYPPVKYSAEDLRYFSTYAELEPALHPNKDTTYVFNFWATWCKPCVKELPYFERAWRKFHNQAVKIVLISLDFPNETDQKLLPFLEEHQLHPDIWVLYDVNTDNWMPRIDKSWITGAIPATLILHDGQRLFHDSAYESYEELEQDLLKWAQ